MTFDRDQVNVVWVDEIQIAALEFRDVPSRLKQAIRKFVEWRKAVGLTADSSATYNIFYDDASMYARRELWIDLCVETDRPIEDISESIINKRIPAGRCAWLRHVGSERTLADAIYSLRAHWLPESGEIARDIPLYIQRVAFPPEVAGDEAITDIYLPLEGRT
jgi:AraC family transcriptional regulator